MAGLGDEQSAARLLRTRRLCGYGAAIAVAPYLLIKVVWTLGLFVPTEEMSGGDWRAVNAATALLAAAGIALALAFCRPWGERLPSWSVALPVWVGTGLLIPMLLLAPVLGPAAISRDEEAGAPDFWVYEQIFIMISLVGVGLGLPLALAAYAKSRWPEALGGPNDCGEPQGGTRPLQIPLARIVALGCVLLGCAKVFWAFGGTLGLVQAELADRDVWWHTLSFSTGLWSFVGAWGILVLTTRRGCARFLPPMAATWISSGMLFAYSVYNLLHHTDMQQNTPEHPLAGALTNQMGGVLGVMMGITLMLVLYDRRRVLRRPPHPESEVAVEPSAAP